MKFLLPLLLIVIVSSSGGKIAAYKKIGEGWCRPSKSECDLNPDERCRLPGIYADGEVHVKDENCKDWCNEEANCIGYGIRKETNGRNGGGNDRYRPQRCVLYGAGMTYGGSVRSAGEGEMKSFGPSTGNAGISCYKRLPQCVDDPSWRDNAYGGTVACVNVKSYYGRKLCTKWGEYSEEVRRGCPKSCGVCDSESAETKLAGGAVNYNSYLGNPYLHRYGGAETKLAGGAVNDPTLTDPLRLNADPNFLKSEEEALAYGHGRGWSRPWTRHGEVSSAGCRDDPSWRDDVYGSGDITCADLKSHPSRCTDYKAPTHPAWYWSYYTKEARKACPLSCGVCDSESAETKLAGGARSYNPDLLPTVTDPLGLNADPPASGMCKGKMSCWNEDCPMSTEEECIKTDRMGQTKCKWVEDGQYLDKLAQMFTDDATPNREMSSWALEQYGINVADVMKFNTNPKDNKLSADEISELFQTYDENGNETEDTEGIERTITLMTPVLEELAKLITDDVSPNRGMSRYVLEQYGVPVADVMKFDKNNDGELLASDISELFQKYDKNGNEIEDARGIWNTIQALKDLMCAPPKCNDDPSWLDNVYGSGRVACVDLKAHPRRCTNYGSYSKEARRACPVSCGVCDSESAETQLARLLKILLDRETETAACQGWAKQFGLCRGW